VGCAVAKEEVIWVGACAMHDRLAASPAGRGDEQRVVMGEDEVENRGDVHQVVSWVVGT
jgi:hypothetical protein